MLKFVNILIDSKHERFREWELHKDSLFGAFIYAFSTDHFRTIIDKLPPETRLFVWIHLDGEKNTAMPNGETQRQILMDQYPNLEGSIFLITSDPNKVNGQSGYGPYTRIQIGEVTKQNDPVTIREILQKPFPLAQSVKFTKSKDDWIIRDLFTQLDETAIREILYETLGGDTDYVVEILAPGFSGALILRVQYNRNNRERFKILKISRNLAAIDSERKNERLGDLVDKSTLLTAVDRQPYNVREWCCLILTNSNRKTLRTILRAFINRNESIKEIVLHSIEVFRKEFYKEFSLNDAGDEAYYVKMLQPFSGGSFTFLEERLTYQGLKISPRKKTQIIQIFHKQRIVHQSEKSKLSELYTAMEKLEAFLEKPYPEGVFFSLEARDLRHAVTPLGYVHGDFHTANILSDKTGEALHYIDFANVPSNLTTHAFLDLGKLSTDLEISILPDGELLYNLKRLLEWRKYHQVWMDPHAPLPDTDWLALKLIYETNEAIQDCIVEKFSGPGKLSKSEAIRQFYMVRLHYLLKAIAYGYEEREKILFFIMASSDILEYLENNQP